MLSSTEQRIWSKICKKKVSSFSVQDAHVWLLCGEYYGELRPRRPHWVTHVNAHGDELVHAWHCIPRRVVARVILKTLVIQNMRAYACARKYLQAVQWRSYTVSSLRTRSGISDVTENLKTKALYLVTADAIDELQETEQHQNFQMLLPLQNKASMNKTRLQLTGLQNSSVLGQGASAIVLRCDKEYVVLYPALSGQIWRKHLVHGYRSMHGCLKLH